MIYLLVIIACVTINERIKDEMNVLLKKIVNNSQ